MTDLTGFTAVVTGGSSGIGRAVALMLARHHANVWVGDLDRLPENDSLFAELRIRAELCDVREETQVERLIQRAAEATGRIDILVNNAGIGMVKPITEVSQEEWDRCLNTNLRGAFFTSKHAIPVMRQHGGSIINVASNAGLLPRAHDPVYSTSKGALIAFTKSLALCHSVDGIRVNAICPGPVEETRMMNADLEAAEDREAAERALIGASPLARAANRMIHPDEVAAAVLYLASADAAMITGTSLAIDGGKSLGVPPSPF